MANRRLYNKLLKIEMETHMYILEQVLVYYSKDTVFDISNLEDYSKYLVRKHYIIDYLK